MFINVTGGLHRFASEYSMKREQLCTIKGRLQRIDRDQRIQDDIRFSAEVVASVPKAAPGTLAANRPRCTVVINRTGGSRGHSRGTRFRQAG
jgi:hypothetical protein